MSTVPEPPDHSGGVLMLSGDLMFASRVRSAAESAGRGFQLSGSFPESDLSHVRMVILDLSTRSGLLPELAATHAERCPQARLVAYGPHVQADLLKSARAAGIETVLTNNQFHQQMATLIR